MPASPPVRVTQKDVAREAGVSHVTVSLALRGRREIPLTTQKKIKAIAKRLGYSPDPMLGALSAYRRIQRPVAFHSNLAFFNSNPNPQGFYVGDYLLYFEGALERAKELGYGLEKVHLVDYHYERRAVQRMLNARGINGLLIAPLQDHHIHVDLDWSCYSAVRFGYSMQDTILHTVTNSQYRTSFYAMEHLVERGYRKIGYISDREFNIRTGGHFLGGYLSATAHFETEPVPVLKQPPVENSNWTPYWESLQRWLEKEKPDAIIAPGPDVLSHIKMWGLRIPRDLGIAALALDKSEKIVSGMHQNARSIGRAAVDLLVSQLERQETGIPEIAMHVLIDSIWIEGQTTVSPSRRRKKAVGTGASVN